MTQEKLNEMIKLHQEWLADKTKGKRLELSDAHLEKMSFHRADLRKANLIECHLQFADFGGSNLADADLSFCNLRHANFEDANLENANLMYSNLMGAGMEKANLKNVDLTNADIGYADLDDNEEDRKGYIVQESFIAYKKVGSQIVTLEILENSIVFGINKKKYRTNRAKVIAIDGNTENGLKVAYKYEDDYEYEVGSIINEPKFNCQYNLRSCKGEGINFVKTKEEAEKYNCFGE